MFSSGIYFLRVVESFVQFCRRHYGNHLCKIISNLDQWFRRECFKVVFYFSSCSHFAQWTGTIYAILVEGQFREHLCKIILNLGQWFPKICCLKVIFISSSGGHFVQEWNLGQWFRKRCHLKVMTINKSGGHFIHYSRTICAILVDLCEVNLNLDQWFRRCSLKVFFFYFWI